MKLTIFILLLPVVAILAGWLAADRSHAFSIICFFTYLLSSVANLVWGFIISRRSRFLGWLCIAVGAVPLILLLLPVRSA